jgi:hypothetical protein
MLARLQVRLAQRFAERLADRKLDALFNREVGARERGDGGVAAARGAGPAIGVGERIGGAEDLVLQRLREHPPFAPAPDFVAERVEDDDVVRATVGKIHFDFFVAFVGDVEVEVDAVADVDVECGNERGVGGAMVGARGGGIGIARARPASKGENGN